MRKTLYTLRFTVAFIFTCLLLASCQKEEAAKVSVSTSTIELMSPKSTFTITSNRAWTLSQTGNYNFNITPTSGVEGTTEVSIMYSANNSDVAREATITILADGATANVKVVQPILEFSLSPNTIEFEAKESTKSITVTSNTVWTIKDVIVPDWVKSVEAVGGSGNGEIKITVGNNTNRKAANTWMMRVTYGGSLSKSVDVIQAPAYNEPPTQPSNMVPANGASNVSLMPTFSWDASTDVEGDEVNYYVQLSTDGQNWTKFAAGKNLLAKLPSTIGVLKLNTTYYYKVTADDEHNKGTRDSEVYKFTTTDTPDAYGDGDYILSLDSEKENPVILIFTGDGYLAEHYKYGGLFDQNTDDAIEAFFEIEPYKSYKEYFKVYKIAAYSNETGLTDLAKNERKDTKFRLEWEGGRSTGISVPNSGNAVFEWCYKIPEIREKGFKNTAIGIIINADVYAGTCLMVSDGKSIAMTPYKQSGSGQTEFANTLRHEMAGHGFGRLADEYRNYNDIIPESGKESLLAWQDYGAYGNVSAFPDIKESPWAQFDGLSDYAHVRMYEGGYLYAKGVWRPEMISCMEDNRPYFNTASRFYIVKRILEIAGEVTPFSSDDTLEERAAKIAAVMEIFVPKDVQKTESSNVATKGGWGGVPYDFIPLGEPILVWE